jgi:hypothetical protein
MQEERDNLESQVLSLEESLSSIQTKYRGNMQEIHEFNSEKQII